jgi:protein SCO1/2
MPKVNRRSLFATQKQSLANGILARASGDDSKSGNVDSRERIRNLYFPNIVLTTHEGKEARFYDDLIKDKIVVINMMYANCEGVCPMITRNLARVQKLLGGRVGRDIFIYSITLKPETDTRQVLEEYAHMHGAGPGWLFLTGKPEDIETLRRKLGFVDPDPEVDRDKSQHIGNVRFGNEPLQLWGACPGMFRPEAIVKSILYVDWPENKSVSRR